VTTTPDDWEAIRERLKQAYVGSREPPTPRWGASTSDGTWKDRMAVLMKKHMAARRRRKWEATKRRWIDANTERLKSGRITGLPFATWFISSVT
jgi:hypothetical protein